MLPMRRLSPSPFAFAADAQSSEQKLDDDDDIENELSLNPRDASGHVIVLQYGEYSSYGPCYFAHGAARSRCLCCLCSTEL